MEADLLSVVNAVPFVDVEVIDRHDTFVGVPNPSSALNFGTHGITLSAWKPFE